MYFTHLAASADDCLHLSNLRKKGKTNMKQMISTLKYARYAMSSLTAVLFLACVGGS